MTKTINLELSKRLAPYLENIETEYIWIDDTGEWDLIKGPINDGGVYGGPYKTLTLEEVIEFLPDGYAIIKYEGQYICDDIDTYIDHKSKYILQTSPINAVEVALNILLDNNLLNEK